MKCPMVSLSVPPNAYKILKREAKKKKHSTSHYMSNLLIKHLVEIGFDMEYITRIPPRIRRTREQIKADEKLTQSL